MLVYHKKFTCIFSLAGPEKVPGAKRQRKQAPVTGIGRGASSKKAKEPQLPVGSIGTNAINTQVIY